jgi:hypothetical protein
MQPVIISIKSCFKDSFNPIFSNVYKNIRSERYKAINFGRLKKIITSLSMKRKVLHSQIEVLLEKLAANNKNLSGHEGKFSQLETDLLRKQCIELYDAINQLHMENMMSSGDRQVIVEPAVSPIIEPEPFIEPPVKDNILPTIEIEEEAEIPELEAIAKSEPEPFFEKIMPEPELVIEKPEVLEVPIKTNPSKFDAPKFEPIADKPIKPTPQKLITEEKSVLDRISETSTNTSLHETISSKKEENELSHRFANSKIEKIKDAIDISKRFELQSNLFGGDSHAYNISISELESAEGKEVCLELFNRFATRYHWKPDNELAMELKSFVYRKYH